MFNERLLRETQMRFVTCIVREHQLWLYGHVARFPDADHAHQILLAREPCEWRRPMGQPRALWLLQVDRHLKEMGMGQASAWGMARLRPLAVVILPVDAGIKLRTELSVPVGD